jgi:hypothetical protein
MGEGGCPSRVEVLTEDFGFWPTSSLVGTIGELGLKVKEIL